MSTEQVVINEVPEGETLEESAARMGLDANGDPVAQEEVKEELPSNAQERPEWLPEKFNSAEDMAKAYSELEGKMSKGEEAPEAGEDAAREATEAAGLNFDDYSTEYAENGELSQGTYDALAQAGIPPELVDQYIAGQEAQMNAHRDSILADAGGTETYNNMTEWAADTFSDAEIDTFNDAVNSGDANLTRMAVAGLKARYEASVGSEPSRMVSGEAASGGSAYRSVAEMMADMQDPRYHNDSAFRSDVQAKLSRSDIM